MKIEKSAIIIETGKQVRVFKSKFAAKWTNAHDYVTQYKDTEIKIVN